MKQLAYIFTALLFLFTACSQDENNSLRPDTGNDEKVTVNFNLSLKDVMYSTEYTPMRAAGEETLVSTEREYKAILFKKFDNYWVIDSLLSLPITDEAGYGRFNLSASTPLKPFSLTLRPGDYHLTLVTNPGFVNWQPYIFEGSIIEINEDNPQPLCGYMTGTESYPIHNRLYLGAEIFSGHTSFTVKKQEDLHGDAPDPLETIELIRRVGRFRIALHDDPSSEDCNFTAGGQLAEQIVCEMIADNDVFCNGLDLWGNPYYDEQNPISQMMYCAMTKERSMPARNNESYFLPYSNSRVFAVHFFTQPGRDVEFRLANIESTMRSGYPYHIYFGEIPGLKIEDNKINGIILKAGPKVEGVDEAFEMYLETDQNGKPVSSAPIFSPSTEYL